MIQENKTKSTNHCYRKNNISTIANQVGAFEAICEGFKSSEFHGISIQKLKAGILDKYL